VRGGAGRRVFSGVAAHLYSQLVTIVTQLATLPVFLSRWDAELYGKWIALVAVPAYLAVADVGIVTAAGNMMSMHQARGEKKELQRVFQAALLVLLIVVPTLALLVGVGLLVLPLRLDVDERSALFLMTLACLVTVSCGLFDAAYRPFGKYPRVTFFLTSARVLEWLGTVAGLLWIGTLTSTAAGFLAGRVTAFLAMYIMARIDVPDVHWTLRRADTGLVGVLARAGLGFVSINLGNLLTLQGMVVLIGAMLNGTEVAIFNSNRTLTRMLAQIAVLSGKSLAPEVSALYGAQNHTALERLNRQVTLLVMGSTLAGALALSWFGPSLLNVWSRGKLPFSRELFSILLATSVTTAFWQIRAVRLTATNRHQLLSAIFVAASVSALLAAYFGIPHFGISAAAGGMLIADAIMIVGTGVALHRATTSPPAAAATAAPLHQRPIESRS
jgi:O-antigen/teichoic acid export membrane protein